MTKLTMKRRSFSRSFLLATTQLTSALLIGVAGFGAINPASADPLQYTILDYPNPDGGTYSTFLTGIRGDNIVGNYIIPDSSGATGGLLYRSDSMIWSPYPVATPDGVNFPVPGTISASPYGPSFGSYGGILRVVGSYKTEASSPFDLGYLYDSAAAPGQQLTTLAYPGPNTEFTIAHSNFGNTVVGNYDTGPLTGNAFIYDIATGQYVTNNKPGAISTTAYGVWGDKIAGGYGDFGPNGEPGFEHGYIYDMSTGTWTTYDHPLSVFTHFEGITGAGRGGEYNLVADWIGPGCGTSLCAAVLHVDAQGNETWIPIEGPADAVPGTVTANSIHQDTVIGVYVSATDGQVHGFVVKIPGIYNPIRNTGLLDVNTPGVAAIIAGKGDDVVNDGTVRTTGANNSGIQSDTYGIVYNNGTVEVHGAGSAAVEMHGKFGALLNAGIIYAAPGADAIRADGSAEGTVVVNYGVIDGRIAIDAGPWARFENSGVIFISSPGAGTTHEISGVYAQTSVGVLGLRVFGDSNDMLVVDGAVRLAGTVAPIFYGGDLTRKYTLVTATDEITGTFETLDPLGKPSFVSASLAYSETQVELNLHSEIALVPVLTGNQRAVGGALDNAFNFGGGVPDGLNAALYGLSEAQLPQALGALSGEIHASERTTLINDALYSREAVLGRLRQATNGEPAGSSSPLGAGADLAVYKAAPAAVPYAPGPTFWVQGIGAWSTVNGNTNASKASSTFYGLLAGADTTVGNNWTVGMALGYSHSKTEVDNLASTADVDSGLIAVYAGTSMGAWKLRTGGTYAVNFIDTTRSIFFPGFAGRASADYNAGTGQVFGEIGYSASAFGIPLEPFAGLAWVHLNTNSFNETFGPAALAGASSASDVGYSTLGLRIATSYMLSSGMAVAPRLSVAWQHAFGDVSPTAALAFAGTTGANYTITGVPLARDAALIDAGLDLRIGSNAKLGVSYFGQLASGATSNAVKGVFTWTF